MATVNEITDAAYGKCGIRTPTTIEDAEALTALNNMLGAWSAICVIPVVIRESLALTIGQSEYTVGVGAAYDLNTVRPMSLENIYLEDADGYSFTVGLVSAKDYNRIGIKTQEGRPSKVYFISEYPAVKLLFNKEPTKAYTAYFEFIKPLTEFAAITDTISLTNEYKEPLIYNLAIRLAEDNSVELSQSTFVIATVGLEYIKKLYAKNRLPSRATFDIGVSSSNIETGEV